MPNSPHWKVDETPKICYFEEKANKYVANSARTLSSGFEKPLPKKFKGYVDFNPQLTRRDITETNTCRPHESRFETFDKCPLILTNHK